MGKLKTVKCFSRFHRFPIPSLTLDASSNNMYMEYNQQSDAFFRCQRNQHNGHLKLISSEILFLTKNICYETPAFCLYIGASPGKYSSETHLQDIFKNFPRTKWLLVDPVFPCDAITPNNFVRTFVTFFEQEHASMIRDFVKRRSKGEEYLQETRCKDLQQILCDLDISKDEAFNFFVICDVRTDGRDEDLILRDMQLQKEWMLILRPVACLLKFRLPYIELLSDKSPLIEKNGRLYLNYLDGEMYRPVYGRKTTTECRLHVTDMSKSRDYDIRKHEQNMFYFNSNTRLQRHSVGRHDFENYDRAAYFLITKMYEEATKRPYAYCGNYGFRF